MCMHNTYVCAQNSEDFLILSWAHLRVQHCYILSGQARKSGASFYFLISFILYFCVHSKVLTVMPRFSLHQEHCSKPVSSRIFSEVLMASCFTLGFLFPQGISRKTLFFISLFHYLSIYFLVSKLHFIYWGRACEHSSTCVWNLDANLQEPVLSIMWSGLAARACTC